MRRFNPTWYSQNLLDIDLNKLKKKGIKVVLFDLDNTIVSAYKDEIDSSVMELITNAKKYFSVYIISNNKGPRVKSIANKLDIGYLSSAHKPLITRLHRFLIENKIKLNETVLIGDQLLTDVYCANKLKIRSLLVEPYDQKDLTITKFNRFFDRKIRARLSKKGRLYKL